MKRPILVVLLLIPLLCSCIVDKELDLRKDIDPIVTVVPGMTATSLFPDSARAAGYSFPEVCTKLIELALED